MFSARVTAMLDSKKESRSWGDSRGPPPLPLLYFIPMSTQRVVISTLSNLPWWENQRWRPRYYCIVTVTLYSVIVWESVSGAKSCGQPIWLKLGTEAGCDEIFQKPLWLTSLTFSFGSYRGDLICCPLSTKNPAFQGAFCKCDKTPLVNCAAKWIRPLTLL